MAKAFEPVDLGLSCGRRTGGEWTMIEPSGLDQCIQLQAIKPQSSAPDLEAATMFCLQLGLMYPTVEALGFVDFRV